MEKRILIFTINGGSGHRTSAEALIQAAHTSKLPWDMVTQDFFECLQDQRKKSTTFWVRLSQKMTSMYNRLICSSCGRGIITMMSRSFIPAYKKILEKRIANHVKQHSTTHPFCIYLRQQQPHLVISVASLINGCLGSIMADCFPNIPFVVIPTDFDEGFFNMWFGSKKAHYLVGTKLLQDKAKKNQHSHFPLSFCKVL